METEKKVIDTIEVGGQKIPVMQEIQEEIVSSDEESTNIAQTIFFVLHAIAIFLIFVLYIIPFQGCIEAECLTAVFLFIILVVSTILNLAVGGYKLAVLKHEKGYINYKKTKDRAVIFISATILSSLICAFILFALGNK